MKKIFLILLLPLYAYSQQQILNGGFEEWYNYSNTFPYMKPYHWSVSDASQFGYVDTSSYVSNGQYSAFLYTRAGITWENGTNAFLVYGTVTKFNTSDWYNVFANLSKAGLPYTDRPKVFGGFYWFIAAPPVPQDKGYIDVVLHKKNILSGGRDTIGRAEIHLDNSPYRMLTPFAAPITYYSTENPDSLSIIITSSLCQRDKQGRRILTSQYGGGQLFIDSLYFSNEEVTAIPKSLEVNQTLSVYPNPSSGMLSLTGTTDAVHVCKIFTSEGKYVRTVSVLNQTVQYGILPDGLYFLQVQSHQKSTVVKFAVRN